MAKVTESDAREQLARAFRRNGYIRYPHEDKREKAKTKYKKGWEVRLVVRTREETQDLLKLLKAAGLKGGKPFAKSHQWVQPVYGKEAAELFGPWRNRDE